VDSFRFGLELRSSPEMEALREAKAALAQWLVEEIEREAQMEAVHRLDLQEHRLSSGLHQHQQPAEQHHGQHQEMELELGPLPATHP
jgi:hypothetical protein